MTTERGIFRGISVVVAALLLVGLAAACQPTSPQPGTGSVTVRAPHATAAQALIAELHHLDGTLVTRAGGHGSATGFTATFTGVAPGTYRVWLAITDPVTTAGGVVTSSTRVTQAPGAITVTAGGTATLTFDDDAWSAVA